MNFIESIFFKRQSHQMDVMKFCQNRHLLRALRTKLKLDMVDRLNRSDAENLETKNILTL